jgi:hypothetical protein
MIRRRSLGTLFAVAVVCFTASSFVRGQQASPDQVAVRFSDPSRPGTLEATVMTGNLTVHGVNRQDVLIESREPDGSSRRPPRPADANATGLRRLTPAGGFEVEEERNVIRVSAGGPGLLQGRSFDIQVPVKTNLHLAVVSNGNVSVSDVDGDFELNTINGQVMLANVSGSVVAHTINGKLQATLARIAADKPMSFTSLNGVVDVTLPAAVKATFKLRSDQGDVFTDFDLQSVPAPKPAVQDSGRAGGKYRIEVNNAIYGAVNGGGPEIELRTFNGSVYLRKGK